MAAAIVITFLFVSPVGDNVYEPSMQAGFITSSISKTNSEAPVQESFVEGTFEIAPVADTVTENIITEEFTPAESDTPKAVTVCGAESETENIVMEAVVEEPAVIESTPAVEEAVVSNSFSIIVASTPNADKAQLAIKELSAKKETNYSVVEGNGRYRIAYGTYSSNEEATEALAEVKSTFPDAWVLTH